MPEGTYSHAATHTHTEAEAAVRSVAAVYVKVRTVIQFHLRFKLVCCRFLLISLNLVKLSIILRSFL